MKTNKLAVLLLALSTVSVSVTAITQPCLSNATITWGQTGQGILICDKGTATITGIPTSISLRQTVVAEGNLAYGNNVQIGVTTTGAIQNITGNGICAAHTWSGKDGYLVSCAYNLQTGSGGTVVLTNHSGHEVVVAPSTASDGTGPSIYVPSLPTCKDSTNWHGSAGEFMCRASYTQSINCYKLNMVTRLYSNTGRGTCPTKSGPITANQCALCYMATKNNFKN